jgi:hypothetical protein
VLEKLVNYKDERGLKEKKQGEENRMRGTKGKKKGLLRKLQRVWKIFCAE